MLADTTACADLVPMHHWAPSLSPATSSPELTLVPGLSREIYVKIASQRDEFEQGFSLLSAKYRARGYEEPSPKLFRFTPFHALPGTITFVAKEGDRVVATLSLVTDNFALGLPMETIYGEEIAQLRADGRHLAEVTSLADDDLSPREFRQVFNQLIRLSMQYHLGQGGDTWVVTVNPRHSGYYRKVLGFAALGGRKQYQAVRDHPAEAHLLDVEAMKSNAPKMHEAILGTWLSKEALSAPRRTSDHARYFGEESTQIDQDELANLIHRIEQGTNDLPRWKDQDELEAA